jgi:hypothetical protein
VSEEVNAHTAVVLGPTAILLQYRIYFFGIYLATQDNRPCATSNPLEFVRLSASNPLKRVRVRESLSGNDEAAHASLHKTC